MPHTRVVYRQATGRPSSGHCGCDAVASRKSADRLTSAHCSASAARASADWAADSTAPAPSRSSEKPAVSGEPNDVEDDPGRPGWVSPPTCQPSTPGSGSSSRTASSEPGTYGLVAVSTSHPSPSRHPPGSMIVTLMPSGFTSALRTSEKLLDAEFGGLVRGRFPRDPPTRPPIHERLGDAGPSPVGGTRVGPPRPGRHHAEQVGLSVRPRKS